MYPNINNNNAEEIMNWLPEYNPIQLIKPVDDYTTLKEHMNTIYSETKESKKNNTEWEKEMLSYINSLGNVVANLSSNFIDGKIIAKTDLVNGYSVALSIFILIKYRNYA